jgi:hypothetical protein
MSPRIVSVYPALSTSWIVRLFIVVSTLQEVRCHPIQGAKVPGKRLWFDLDETLVGGCLSNGDCIDK